MAYAKLIPRFTPGANVEEISNDDRHKAYRLTIPAGSANQYRLAQLDDYTQNKRSQFPLRFPLSVILSARVSSDSIPGTWGFGLWNDPFGLSLGFGGNPWRLPTLPNAVWFFGASEESYLSFKTARAERNEAQSKGKPQTTSLFQDLNSIKNRASTTDVATSAPPSAHYSPNVLRERGIAANGFLAQTFRSPWFHPLLILAGLTVPFSRKTTRRLLGKIIEEDGLQIWSPTARRQTRQEQVLPRRHDDAPALQTVEPTQWHRYMLEWRENQVSFEVDDVQVFESPVSPNPPLGLVIWIDNQYAAFTPEGKIGFGVLENPKPAWLDVKDIELA
jgi:hypothetical protein